MRTVVITGGTGLVGSALTELLLQEGCRVIVYSRDPEPPRPRPGLGYAHWDPAHGILEESALLEADQVVHLAGEPIAEGHWTAAKRQAIGVSRVAGARLIAECLSVRRHHVGTVVSASGISIYGDRGDKLVTESDAPGRGFLPEVCREWEAEALKMERLGIRVAVLRTPPVLTASSPLLAPLRTLLRLGIAAVPGSGETWMSWIHLRDLVRVYSGALADAGFSGTFNAVSPFPVTIGQLSGALARVIKGRFTVPVYVPGVLLKLMAGEKGAALLTSTRASAAKLLRTGFEFSYPTIGAALEEIYDAKGADAETVSRQDR
jgi:uncharacterized protein (TIGR01777 family)